MRQRTVRITIAMAALAASGHAAAQSTATQIEEGSLSEVTVTATRAKSVAGLIQVEQAPKSRTTVTEEYLQTQMAGQSVIQSLNLVPGVNFTNSDPYGSSGGNLRIRSFDGPRISLMVDGVPLNDTGNYAIYSGQQLDPEIIERATVNLGTTDIDSPTASATGGTINLVTIMPSDKAQVIVQPSFGSDSYWRVYLQGDTGKIGPWGTKAFFTVSRQEYEKFKGPGDLEKTQFNGRVYQELDDGDFMSLAFHYNRNRNAFYRNLGLADIAAHGYDFDNDATCLRPAAIAGSMQNEASSATSTTANCTNYYGVRINPSNTGNIRGQASFGLTDALRLTVDPSFQYTLANGGGITVVPENDPRLIGRTTVRGVDLNGDGDLLDRIAEFTPNNTSTHRYTLSTSLLWTLNEKNLLHFSYVLDYGRHRQTGQYGVLDQFANPDDVFAGRNGKPVVSADGTELRQRDRFTIARLNQLGASYTTQLWDDKAKVVLGVRAPWFERQLNQYCYTQVSNGVQYCTSQAPNPSVVAGNVTFPGSTTAYIPPYSGVRKYDKVLPNVGASFKPWSNEHEIYVSYAQGLSAPRTDNLYNVQILDIVPETTDSYDLGYRYEGSTITGSAALWKSHFQNRIVSSFDPDLGYSTDRNVGTVNLWGVDTAIGTEVFRGLTLYGTASYNHSKVVGNIQFNGTTQVPTAGKELVETPNWTAGARAEYTLMSSLKLGLQGKYVGARWATDVNDQEAPSYTVLDADARYDFDLFGMQTFVQLNVLNLTDKDYLGSVATSRFSANTTKPYGTLGQPLYAIGAPRTVQFTVNTRF